MGSVHQVPENIRLIEIEFGDRRAGGIFVRPTESCFVPNSFNPCEYMKWKLNVCKYIIETGPELIIIQNIQCGAD
jgi:hypothetical protein